MRRTAILVLAAASALAGCSSGLHPRDRGVETLLVVNNTDQPITVSFAQDPANAESTAVSLEQRVLPSYSVRLAGRRGDRVTVQAGDEPPMVVEYAKRSYVLSVTGEGGAVRFDLRKGFREGS